MSNKSVITEEQKKSILKLHTERKLGYYAIAKELNLNHGSIRYWLRKLSLEAEHEQIGNPQNAINDI